MANISLAIKNKLGEFKQRHPDFDRGLPRELFQSGVDEVCLASQFFEYEEGDQIEIIIDQPGRYLVVKLDETMDSSLVYLKDKHWNYQIYLDEKLHDAAPDTRFKSHRHSLFVRLASKEEIEQYRNLALNPHDQKDTQNVYPHASANVETRDDATFFACNAIDGNFANSKHGSYPFSSWGINQQADAALTIDFGRLVALNRVGFTWRADFPHDSFWEEATLLFDDQSEITFKTVKTEKRQTFDFATKQTTWVKLMNLKKAEDVSPFPALTQIELFGRNCSQTIKKDC